MGRGAHERIRRGGSGEGRASSHEAPAGRAGRRPPCPNGAPLENFGGVARREEAAEASRWGLGPKNRPSGRCAENTGAQRPGIFRSVLILLRISAATFRASVISHPAAPLLVEHVFFFCAYARSGYAFKRGSRIWFFGRGLVCGGRCAGCARHAVFAGSLVFIYNIIGMKAWPSGRGPPRLCAYSASQAVGHRWFETGCFAFCCVAGG